MFTAVYTTVNISFYILVLSNGTKRCAAENGVWKETPQCSVTRASDTESCSFADANGIINIII